MCAGAASSSQDVTGVSQAQFRKLLLVLESIRSPSLGHHRKTSHCLTTTFMAQKVSFYKEIYIYIQHAAFPVQSQAPLEKPDS